MLSSETLQAIKRQDYYPLIMENSLDPFDNFFVCLPFLSSPHSTMSTDTDVSVSSIGSCRVAQHVAVRTVRTVPTLRCRREFGVAAMSPTCLAGVEQNELTVDWKMIAMTTT